MSEYDRFGNRQAPYKSDSTKGASIIDPRDYKGDVLTQVWVDSRILATLCRWLEQGDTIPKYMSEIVREPLRILVEHLVKGGDVEMVEDTSEAREMLNRRFRVDLNKGGNRGKKNIVHNQVLTDRRIDRGVIPDRKDLDDPKNSRRNISNDDMKKMLDIYNGLITPEAAARIKEEALKNAREAGAIVDIDDSAPRKREWNKDMAPRPLTEEEIREKEREIIERDRKYEKELNKDPREQMEEMRRLGQIVDDKK